MSGPVSTLDAPPTETTATAEMAPCVQVLDDREAMVGAIRVRRALPGGESHGRRVVLRRSHRTGGRD